MRHRLNVLAIVAILISVAAVKGQDREVRVRLSDSKPRGLDVARAVEETRSGNSSASLLVAERVKKAYMDDSRDSFQDPRLTGTWYVTVPVDDTTVFHAFQTFGSDGTFVETSSLLGTLVEGPAHGVWENRRRGAVLTFEVFEFDPDGHEAGRVRVRNLIRLIDDDHFTAYSVVDFIDLNGEITEAIATGIFTGKRMQIRGL